jgi:DNA-binding NarL/FixJ family response regulator
MTSARILIVDDHQIMRDGLRLLLRGQEGLEVVGDAFDSETGWRAVQEMRPDLVILDVELPGTGGVPLARRVQRAFPETKVVILTGHAEEKFISAALQSGVQGYVLKELAGAELLTALRAVLAGQIYLAPEVSTLVVRSFRRQLEAGEASEGRLTDREREVLRRVAEGETTKGISFSLGVSMKTIETHRLNLMRKLGLRSVAELTKYALREGLTTL